MKKFFTTKVGQIIGLLFGLLLIAVSIKFFYQPYKVAAGGTTGIGILLNARFGIDTAYSVFILNLLMLVLAYFFLGQAHFRKVLLGSLLLPVFLYFIPEYKIIPDNILLTVIAGAIIFATGVAIIYQIDASAGGTTIPPLILNKYFGFNTSITLLIVDSIISFFNIFVSGYETFILAIISLLLTAVVMNFIETGINRKKALYIFNSHGKEKEVRKAILSHQGIGFTEFEATGGYKQDKRKIFLLIVDSAQYYDVLTSLKAVDDQIFVITENASDVSGGRYFGENS